MNIIDAVLGDFFWRALIGGLGVALVAGPLGCFVVWRRMAYFGDTLAHSALLGIAMSFLISIPLNLGVIITCLLIAMALVLLSRTRALATDTLLGILAHSALAIGLVTLSFMPDIRVDLTGLLFGDLLAMNRQDLLWIFGGAVVVLGLLAMLWRQLLMSTIGLVIAAVLILVARPIAVLPVMKLFGFNAREASLVAWVGLRGSVPIILAIFPLMFGLEGAELIFNVVFFVVLISATIQGTTLPVVARKLGLTEKPPAVPAASLEITALEEVDADIVEYTLSDHPRAAGRRLSQMALPDTTVVAMITRGKDVIPPRGSTELMAGDHLFVVLRPETRPFIDCVFSDAVGVVSEELPDQELKLKGSTRIDDLRHSYGVLIEGEDGQTTLDALLRNTLSSQPEIGDSLQLDGIMLAVLATLGGRITTVGLTVQDKPDQ